MRRTIIAVAAMLFIAIGATAQSNDETHDRSMTSSTMAQQEHLAHLRELLASMSSHGPVIPQPASVHTESVQNITVTAKSFNFTTSVNPFTVNQGDVVNLTLTVPAGDPSTIGHGILMESYIENGLDCARGHSVQMQFTATTAGTFAFVCDLPDCGSGHSSMFGTFHVNAVTNPAPTISSIAPATGSALGGTSVTITGTGFLAGATVKLGGTVATNINVVSPTSITATTPAHAAGKVDVVVSNSDGKSGTLAQAFTYPQPDPTISGVSPATGPTTGGTPVTITGTNFQPGATVTFGARAATDVTVVSDTSITARTPLGPATQQLAVNVVVTNPDSTTGTGNNAFTYTVPPLAVISVTPNSALPSGTSGAGPTTVTIFGTGITSAVSSSVMVGSATATSVQVVDAVTLRATFPALPPGTADVVVTVGGSTATLKNGFSWQNPPPKRRAAKH